MPNRLAEETSPYLRQHQDNPVDWLPWGDEAFARAEREGKPIFLSVGYSSCHWCHVMAHESFESDDIAQRLNRDFIAVKVDREERPDIDEAYMAFVQMTTGRGGWPMSVFLTPQGQPFYGGTYWPKDDRGQQPGFTRVLDQLAAAWKESQPQIVEESARIGEELRRYFANPSPITAAVLDSKLYSDALQAQAEAFDPEHGGFGQAPKFPPHTALDLLMGQALSPFADGEERQATLAMSFVTLEKMCLGGIHDHVGGGFHRYSTDGEWLLPHFEKMLYDNALMLSNLARATMIANEVDPGRMNLFARAAGGIVTWLQREMTSPEGLFYSALDADSEGEEGAFYVWSADELADLSDEFCSAFDVRPGGNFADEATGQASGKNILHLGADVAGAFDAELDVLLAKRVERERPGLDHKAIVAWNGLMVGALAEAGLSAPAERACLAILQSTQSHGRLPHQIVDGVPSGDAFLDDFAAFADGLFKLADLFDAEGQPQKARLCHETAVQLGHQMIEQFEDPATGAYLSTGNHHEILFGRSRQTFDQPIPSGNALALRVLVAMGEVERAQKLVAAVLGIMERAPTATEGLYAAALPLVETVNVNAEEPVAPIVATTPKTAKVSLAKSEMKADGAGLATFTVVLDLPDGIHVNGSEPPARWLTPTKVTVRPLKAEIRYPAEDGMGYVGRIEIPFAVTLPMGESGADLEIVVGYQPCTDHECLSPVETVLSAVIYR